PWIFFFFFQAEDGIRDLYVTGVQTCALPIFALPVQRLMLAELGVEDHRQEACPGARARDDVEWRRRLGDPLARPAGELLAHGLRSEERRVGKQGRCAVGAGS